MKRLDICSTADQNYAVMLKVLIVSVIENNKKIETIVFHIFETGMSIETIQSIKELEQDNIKIYFYDVEKEIKFMQAKVASDWAKKNSYMTYARFYMPALLPEEIDKFLYLDSDTLVTGTLEDLKFSNNGNYIVAGVKDTLPYFYKKKVGDIGGTYINAGVLLVEKNKWINENVTEKLLKYCCEHPEDVYADQDAINAVLADRIENIHPKYCVFYPEYSFTYNDQIRGYGNESTYYSFSELNDANNNPVIIHYVDTVLGRPWQSNNINPYAKMWNKYFNMLPEYEKIVFKPKKNNCKQKIFRMLYKLLPDFIFAKIYYKNRNKGVYNKMKGDKGC